MTILLQAIQEYLTEYHPNWRAAPGFNKDTISIISQHRRTPIIMLYTDCQTIITPMIDNTECAYTDHTLLQQITTIINSSEQLIRTTMHLLLQVIQEYLKDNHPNWRATLYKYDENIINIIDITNPHRSILFIMLNTDKQTIITIKNKVRTETTYTNHTLLPQLTDTIHQIEQLPLIPQHTLIPIIPSYSK